jgi:hypothetical protein
MWKHPPTTGPGEAEHTAAGSAKRQRPGRKVFATGISGTLPLPHPLATNASRNVCMSWSTCSSSAVHAHPSECPPRTPIPTEKTEAPGAIRSLGVFIHPHPDNKSGVSVKLVSQFALTTVFIGVGIEFRFCCRE